MLLWIFQKFSWIYKNGKSEQQNCLNSLKNYLNCFKYNVLGFQKFSKKVCEYIRVENLNYKNKDIERKYLENMWNIQLLKIKNRLLELEKDLWNDKIENWKIGEKIKTETKELLYKLTIVSKDDMDRFEEEELKKTRPIRKAGVIS